MSVFAMSAINEPIFLKFTLFATCPIVLITLPIALSKNDGKRGNVSTKKVKILSSTTRRLSSASSGLKLNSFSSPPFNPLKAFTTIFPTVVNTLPTTSPIFLNTATVSLENFFTLLSIFENLLSFSATSFRLY